MKNVVPFKHKSKRNVSINFSEPQSSFELTNMSLRKVTIVVKHNSDMLSLLSKVVRVFLVHRGLKGY
jgi:hypothetical protein